MLGLLKYQRGDFPEALRLIAEALKTNARSVDGWSNLGLVFDALGRHAQALESFDQALAIQSDHADVLNNRGTTLIRLGRHNEALESFAKALAQRPDSANVHYNRGTTLLEAGQFQDALACFDSALALASNHANALCNRGSTLIKLNRIKEAVSMYELALRFAPDNPIFLHNHAHALRTSGRPREALASADKALGLKPDYASARFEQSLALLALGDLRGGFAAYESRWQTTEFIPLQRNFSVPTWLGQEELIGKTLLLHAEQGFGDTLQFVRYAPLVARRGAKVILEVQPALKSLISGIEGASLVLARGEPLPPFHLHCPLMSLPHAVRTELGTIPVNIPYLAVNSGKVAHWAERLSAFSGMTKVGLVWAGERRKHDLNASLVDQRRSVSLRHFAPLAEIINVQFFSLQKGSPSTEALQPPPRMQFVDMTSDLDDFGDTAALIMNLDLVISVDTSVAHLAGALGKPVWILSRFDGCWRWLNGREDSPWYPAARIFHQKAPGNWDHVIMRLRNELLKFSRQYTH